MVLDADICYRAVASRDTRFDGRFFTAVLSTGVYCRPICPARTPRRENCRFFACAAAAEAAGFRPCLRCRPETAPGTPAWRGASATVDRAVRLIGEGALDEDGVDGLAARLGVGARHLRRLFLRHLGAAPLAVAQTRRAHFARQLLAETNLSITRIALAAGFGSVRRFNAAMRAAYGAAPSTLRRSTPALAPVAEGPLLLRLSFRPPLDWDGLLAFLRARAIPGVEMVSGATYRRTLAWGPHRGLIEIRPVPGAAHLALSVSPGLVPVLNHVVARARRLCDLAAEPAEIAGHLARDSSLAPLVRARPGLRVPGACDPFELAVRAILGQQISVHGAVTLAGRLVRAAGDRLPSPQAGLSERDGEPLWLFPSAEALANVDLRSIGMTGARAAALRALARAAADGALTLDPAAEPRHAVEALERLPGVGPWTAQYIAMRGLGDPDAFPSGDLGLRRAWARLTKSGSSARESELATRAEAWRPWRAYAAMHLWTALGDITTELVWGPTPKEKPWHAKKRHSRASSGAARSGRSSCAPPMAP